MQQPRSLGLVFSYFVCFCIAKVYKQLMRCICLPTDLRHGALMSGNIAPESPFCNIYLIVNTMIMVWNFSGKW